MKKKSLTLYSFYSIIALCFLVLNSCSPAKNVVYFQNLQRDTIIPDLVTNNFELKIRKNDLLYIGIISPDPVSTALFNAPQGPVSSSSQSGTGFSNSTGYLVDYEGNIMLYKLGSIRVEGLTREELKLKLQKDLEPYLKDAVVTVRFLNNHVTILGEVTKPQVLTMTSEKFSLLEAIGMTGDITITGRKDNVLLVRETPSGKIFKRLNLTDNSIITSPFYYLKPDDIVYVEPTPVKLKNSGDTPQNIGYILSGASIVITILINLLR